MPSDWLPSPLVPLWWWYGCSFLQITLIGGLTDVDGVMGSIGDELLWWLDVLKALSPLLTAFDVWLLLLWLFVDELLLLFPPLALPLDASVGVCLMCDDFVPELVVLVVEFVVLLFDDDEVVFELLEFRVVDEALPEDFELLRLDVDDEDVWCCNCCRHFARRFLNQTWRKRRKFPLITQSDLISFHVAIESFTTWRSKAKFRNARLKILNWIFFPPKTAKLWKNICSNKNSCWNLHQTK